MQGHRLDPGGAGQCVAGEDPEQVLARRQIEASVVLEPGVHEGVLAAGQVEGHDAAEEVPHLGLVVGDVGVDLDRQPGRPVAFEQAAAVDLDDDRYVGLVRAGPERRGQDVHRQVIPLGRRGDQVGGEQTLFHGVQVAVGSGRVVAHAVRELGALGRPAPVPADGGDPRRPPGRRAGRRADT